MKSAVVHIGMPKAASTSIQLALLDAQATQLTPNELWFTPPNGEFSDFVVYDMLAKQDLHGVRAYADAKFRDAKASGADTVIFSAERLFTIDHMLERMTQLGDLLSDYADEVCFVVVVRDLKPFLKSYMIQMAYNGSAPLQNKRLAEWAIDQVRAIADCEFPVHFLPLSLQGNIAERLIAASTGRKIELDLPRANVTPVRPITYALVEGLAARLYSLQDRRDVNSRTVDQFRTEFAQAFDNSVLGSKDPGEINRVLYDLDAGIDKGIEQYIECSIDFCSAEKIAYYNAIANPPAPVREDLADAA